TALAVLKQGIAFVYPEAFTPDSYRRLKSFSGFKKVIEVPRDEAMSFALNWVEVGNSIIIGSYVPNIQAILEFLGKTVRIVPLTQFQFAGGSAACLTSQVHSLNP